MRTTANIEFHEKRTFLPSSSLPTHSRGQVAVVLTLAIVMLVGAMSLGTDIAVLYFNWVQLQKAADAAALAGANYLPNYTDKAISAAQTFAESNGIAANEIDTPTLSGGNTQIAVSLHRTVPFYFARVLGLTSGRVSAAAAASAPYSPMTIGAPPGFSGGGNGTPNPICGNSTGQYDVIPIAVSNETASSFVAGQIYTLNRTGGNGNTGSWVDAPGNWGMVNLCGANNGGAVLRATIANGFYGPISVGQTLQTLPGITSGPVDQGFSDRIGASADAWGITSSQCKQNTIPSGTPTHFDPADPRAVVVPMVSGFSSCTGSCTVTITGFLAFYIDCYNSGAIRGHFITKVQTNSVGVPTFAGDAGMLGDPVLIK